jgi:hypothetical protein
MSAIKIIIFEELYRFPVNKTNMAKVRFLVMETHFFILYMHHLIVACLLILGQRYYSLIPVENSEVFVDSWKKISDLVEASYYSVI